MSRLPFVLLLLGVSWVSVSGIHPRDDVPNFLRVEPDRLIRTAEIEKAKFRLNDDTYPIHYKLKIYAFRNPETTYRGEVEVEFKARRAASSVVVNQQGIQISDTQLYKIIPVAEGEEAEIVLVAAELVVDNDYEKFEIKLTDEELDPELNYLLVLAYEATVFNDMRGYYQSYYMSATGNKIYLGTTHFGQQARRLTPCWDEPEFKATWQITVRRDRRVHTRSVSNANIEFTIRDPESNNYDIDTFKTTAPIPAYILALVTSDFGFKADAPIGQHKTAIYARPNAVDQTQFAFDNLLPIVQAFNNWTGLDYFEFRDVEKLDMAAIPDFSAGAMENWGLLIHREVNVLADDNHTNTLQKFRIADVISHEVAHQWFGDLVTTNWWDATWINEGFAAYFEYVGLDPVHRDWDVMSEFVSGAFQNAMVLDAQPTSHPMAQKDIYNYADIRTMFTSISYDKAASVIRMINNIMGSKFQDGVREYLRT